jgi:hypothetical protein
MLDANVTAKAECLSTREPRKRVLLSGKLLTHQSLGSLDVTVRNITDRGAMIELAQVMTLSGAVELLLTRDNRVFPAEVRWIKGNRMGLRFLSKGREIGVVESKKAPV